MDAAEQQRRHVNEAAASLLRRRDQDRYWSVLFAPARKRAGLIALYAYNAELARIAASAQEPMVAQIRLQWWRDAIDLASPGTRTGNPVADALTAAMTAHDLPKERLIAMADARVPEIFGDPPADIQGLRAAVQATEGTVFELAAWILGDRGILTAEAAGHAGLAYGLVGLLRTIPAQLSRRKLLLPPSYFEQRAVDIPALYQGKAGANFGAALADLRGASNRAYQRYRGLAPRLDPAIFPAFLILTLVKPYLRAMASPGFEPLNSFATINPARRFWRIWRAARLGTL